MQSWIFEAGVFTSLVVPTELGQLHYVNCVAPTALRKGLRLLQCANRKPVKAQAYSAGFGMRTNKSVTPISTPA